MLRGWALTLAIAMAAIGVSSPAPGDELTLRNRKLQDKHVYDFDEDGVRLAPGDWPIGWELIESGRLDQHQERFDALRTRLSGPLRELHSGLANGNYASILVQAQALFPTYSGRRSTTAYIVAQALMWAQLAVHQSEAAIEPYFVCVTLKRTVKELASPPGSRRLLYDSRTGLCPELALVGFDRERAKVALPGAQARLRALGTTSAPGLRLYLAALALAAGDAAAAEAELAAIESPPPGVAELAEVLRAQASVVRGQTFEAISRLQRLRDGSRDTQRALVDYVMGQARLAAGKGNPIDGVLDLLNVAAVHGEAHPAIAAAALYGAQKALGVQHDEGAAKVVQIELLRSFPQTDHGAQLRADLGPDSAVVKEAAELDAAEAAADSSFAAEGGDLTKDRGRPVPKQGRRRPGRP